MVQRRRTADNALGRELSASVEHISSASADEVYDVLADLRSHAIWGGERQSESTQLLTIDAPESEAVVGTEFGSTGADPMGRFTDRSVVTSAIRPSVFEFVTEAELETKRGAHAVWTNVHRYELRPQGEGTTIAYTITIARISALPGIMRVFNVPGLSALAMKASTSVPRRGLQNLAQLAEERATARGRRR